MPDAVEVEVPRDLSTAWATPAKEAALRAFEKELKTRAEGLDARERRIEERERQLRAQQAPESAAKADGEAAEKARDDAVRVLQVAGLGEAQRLLGSLTCQDAAASLLLVTAAAADCAPEARDTINAAERAVRDVVALVLKWRANPGSVKLWDEAAEHAFSGPLDRNVRAALLLAFHKRVPDAFPSNNKIANARRGHPRPRRTRRFPDAALPMRVTLASRDETGNQLQQEEEKDARPTSQPWTTEPAFVNLGVVGPNSAAGTNAS